MSTAVAEQPHTHAPAAGSCGVNTGPKVTITAKAASEVRRIMAEQASGGLEEKLHLRLRVVGGGCSGFQHKLDLDPQVNEKLDDTFELEGVPLVVDKRSALYLDGVVVDFHDDLNKRGFSVDNANAKSKCGCGSSFSM